MDGLVDEKVGRLFDKTFFENLKNKGIDLNTWKTIRKIMSGK